MPFLSEEFVVAAAAVIVFVFMHIMLYIKVVDLKSEIDALERRLKDKADRRELELSDRIKQLHSDKLAALEEHLGVLFFDEPKRLVVKLVKENQK